MESKVQNAGVVVEFNQAVNSVDSDLSQENARLKQKVESLQALLLGPPPQHSPGTRLRPRARRLSAPSQPSAGRQELKVRSFPAPVAEQPSFCEVRSSPPTARAECEVRSGRPSVASQVDCEVRCGRPSVVPQVECEARPCRPSVVPQVECRPTRSPRMSTTSQMTLSESQMTISEDDHDRSEVDCDFARQPSLGPSTDDEEDAETDRHGDATSIGEASDAQVLKGMDFKYPRPPEGHWTRRDSEGGACGCQVQ